jgi:hypothetical protein
VKTAWCFICDAAKDNAVLVQFTWKTSSLWVLMECLALDAVALDAVALDAVALDAVALDAVALDAVALDAVAPDAVALDAVVVVFCVAVSFCSLVIKHQFRVIWQPLH